MRNWYIEMKVMSCRVFKKLHFLPLLLLLATCNFEIDYKQYALVYGIADYNVGTDLQYSDDDALAMGALFSSQGYEVTVRTDSAATYDQLIADFDAIKSQIGKDDLFVFFFSGHGCDPVPAGGEEPPTGDANDEGIVLNTATDIMDLYDDVLGQLIKSIPSRKKIVIIDACYSGGFIGNELETETSLFEAIQLYTNYRDGSYDIDPQDALVISASGEQEFSFEYSLFSHGVFTYFLLETADRGDHNGDGYVTALEAFYYTKGQIKGTSDQFSPDVSGGPVDFVLFEAD
jgi:uncharacterized caspase-like protein